ncbi:hypothetical protein EDD11_006576 [Mortierella claussenii]|nr:hypothetical protein EDD11_006576 [Mortierella claussenii]
MAHRAPRNPADSTPGVLHRTERERMELNSQHTSSIDKDYTKQDIRDSNDVSMAIMNLTTPDLQPRRQREQVAPILTMLNLDDSGGGVGGEENFLRISTRTASLMGSPANATVGTTTAVTTVPLTPRLPSWEYASEIVVRNTIQYLIKDNDMELSYTSILSMINMLNSKDGEKDFRKSILPVMETTAPCSVVALFSCKDVIARIGRLYSKLLWILTRPDIATGLTQETRRQGQITPKALYFQLYNGIQDAGCTLQDRDHFRICQFLLDHHAAEDALLCLDKIDPARWSGSIFRTAIRCHLFSKPRRLHEAEVVLNRYLEHIRTPMMFGAAKPHIHLAISQDGRDQECVNKVMIRRWFKLQLDASKWEEIKTQYERKRNRVVEAPGNIDRFSTTAATAATFDPYRGSALEGGLTSVGPSFNRRSPMPSTTDAFNVISNSSQTSASTTDLSQVPVSENSPAFSALSSFSTLSVFRSINHRHSTVSASSSTENAMWIKSKAASAPIPKFTIQTSPPSNIQINHHLTALDNSMLEECVNHKQFEYGWKHIYERMGPQLEDRNTARIVLRLCKRAILGHGGPVAHQFGSPNTLTTDVCFEDEFEYPDENYADDDKDDGISSNWDDSLAILQAKQPAKQTSKSMQQDPELWEARAWVVYNKAMLSPDFSCDSGSSRRPSPKSGLSTISQHQHSLSFAVEHSRSYSLTGGKGPYRMDKNSLPQPSSHCSMRPDTSSLTTFLHNILIVAINSPERSSRFLKAFKVYSAMRDDPMNQYQAQLRDPFVLTCIIKAIYDTALSIIGGWCQQEQAQEQQRRELSQDSAFKHELCQQTMDIGPLIDLAFEIYADMRNLGPIRLLPHLSASTTSKNMHGTSRTPGDHTDHSMGTFSHSDGRSSSSNSLSMFFRLSNRPPISSSSTVSLSTYGSFPSHSPTSLSFPVHAFSVSTATIPLSPADAMAAMATTTLSCTLQDLNPTLCPNPQARRLPNEIYLALLHLCLNAGISGLEKSRKVVKTIVADMMTTYSGQQPANLDRHLAAALQMFHDQWLCRPQELKGRGVGDSEDRSTAERQAPKGMQGAEEGTCVFHGWMYRSEEYDLGYMVSLGSSSNTASSLDLLDTSNIPTDALPANQQGSRKHRQGSDDGDDHDGDSDAAEGKDDEVGDLEEHSHYSISKRDADLDELDKYLQDRVNTTSSSCAATRLYSDTDHSHSHVKDADGNHLDHDSDSCNSRFYWDLWGRGDPVFQRMKFSRRRARSLWQHVASLENR